MKHRTVRALYRKLLGLYPDNFRTQLAESMEQTFNDLYNEKRQAKQGLAGFMTRTFAETAVGIVREHLFLSKGMNHMLTDFMSSALISLLLILPFMIMEVVNRRNFNEDFPITLFSVLWLNLFAISLILLPIMRARRAANQDTVKSVPAHGSTLFTNPRSSLIISIALFLSTAMLFWLSSLGWAPMDRLFDGPNPEQPYIFGQILSIALISIPVAAGVIAGRPIVSTLRAGGSLFAHPIHLIIVVVLSFLFAAGVVGLVVDQWPCFIGVQFCD